MKAVNPQSRPTAPWRDEAGARKRPRHVFRVRPQVHVDEVAATLVDLSVAGAQLRVPLKPEPGKQVELVLQDGAIDLRLETTVVWAHSEEPFKSNTAYCMGLQ